MNNVSLYAPIIDPTITFITVQFDSTVKLYTYKCDFECDVGDLVIVEARDWYQIARVADVNVSMPIESDIVYKWVVGRVPMASHKRRLAQEDALIKSLRTRRADALRAQMLNALGIDQHDAYMLVENAQRHVDDLIDADVIDDDEGDDH